MNSSKELHDALLNRFFRYVKIDTQSREDVSDQFPSTEKQKDLAMLLVDELKDLGLVHPEMDQYGYVTATLPGRIPSGLTGKVPVVGLLAHMDTSPEVSGTDVKPVLHNNYQGGDLELPGDPEQTIRVAANPALEKQIGHDIITSDGTTLLGADNKAGIAEIMTMLEYIQKNREIDHPTLRVGFTPDEEVGQGTKYFDIQKFSADVAYTVDGEEAGDVENETFNAASAVFAIRGINMHPGYAKGKMVNAVRILADLIRMLENEPAPETTSGREGYLHPYVVEGGVEKAMLKMLIRDFEMEGIEKKIERLKSIQHELKEKHGRAQIHLEITHQYRNMRFKLDERPEVVEYALEAVRRAGLQPRRHIIRGGTDGARLSYQGLPTPNLFTGGHNFHSKREWISVQDMEKAVKTLIHLVQIWVDKSQE